MKFCFDDFIWFYVMSSFDLKLFSNLFNCVDSDTDIDIDSILRKLICNDAIEISQYPVDS